MLAEHAEPPVLAYSGDASADSGARHRQVHEPRAQVEELARVERLREDVGEVVVAVDERRLELARLHELAHVEVTAVDVLRARVDGAGVVRDVDDAAGRRGPGRPAGRTASRASGGLPSGRCWPRARSR